MNISAKLSGLFGLRKQPEQLPTSAGSSGSASPSSERLHQVRSVASRNKMTLIILATMVLLGGALYGLRKVSSSLRGMRVTPGDPNLYRTVKTAVGKSSMVSSVEAEINTNNLDGQSVNPEVSLVAKKFNYRPLGQLKAKKLLDTGRVKETIPVPVSAVVAPAPAPKEKIIVRTVYPKTKRHREKPVDDDPFNTVHVGSSQSVATATPTSTPSVVSTSKEAETTRYIPAAVYGKQTVRSGGKVRFRTTEAVTFQGVYIPRNTILTAAAYLGSGRMQFQVPARIVAGQKLPVDLMCVDKDYQTGITYNYDYVNDNMRQVGGSTVNDAVSSTSSYMNYGSSALGVAGQLGSTAVRGIANAITSGRRQKTLQQVEIQNGYQVFFKSTKN